MQSLAAGRVSRILCELNTWWLNANSTTVNSLAARFHEQGFEIEDATERQHGPTSGDGTFDLPDVLYRYAPS